jgi:hypothetical protein
MRTLIALAAALLVSGILSAQYPASFAYEHLEVAPNRDFEPFDYTFLWEQASEHEARGEDLMGMIRFDGFDFFEYASFDVLPNGTEVRRLRFHSDDARALTVYFDDFHLPVGAELYIYNADKSYFEGPIDAIENNDHRQFVTNDIYGEDLILEYNRPLSAIGEPSLHVSGVGYLFRYVHRPDSNTRGSEFCQVDVKCPEAEPWECQIDAAVRLRITAGQGIFVCSGVMVNTTVRDCRQYLLSALHCITNVNNSDLALMQVRFSYERNNCGAGLGFGARNRTGVIKLADSADGGGNTGSDFVLFEVEDEIPDSWNPYFAGWDASGSGSLFGAGIHHPAGDVKKISFYTTNLTSQWWGAPGSHWGVRWSPTESGFGVTEGGSSGSPIFNAQGLIIGTLTGGLSACEVGGAGSGTGPTQIDFYGKMSHHWSNNPNSAAQKLRVWLDPLGSGPDAWMDPTTVLHGAYKSDANLACGVTGECDAVSVNEEMLTASTVVIAPNPTSGEFFIRLKGLPALDRVVIYDQQGRLVAEERMTGPVMQMSLANHPSGIYFVMIQHANGAAFTQRVVKMG